MYLIGLLVAVIAVTAFVYFRRAADKPGVTPTATAAEPASKFHAVSIRPGGNACDAARDLRGRRFLSPEAPALPLAGCDRPDCGCRFTHHGDRRSDEDRRSPYPSKIWQDTGAVQAEQRESADRRKSDN